MSNRLSVVAPVFNEEATIREFHRRLGAVLDALGMESEIIYVNDGSSDASEGVLAEIRTLDRRVRVLTFSRNFGHQIAVKAGIDHASGDAVVLIDSDLQDPPEAIPDLVNEWKKGYDVAYAVRSDRAGETWFKKWTAALYYRLMKKISNVDIPLDTGDFRLISRRVAAVMKTINEHSPYIRGLISWVGFRQIGIPVKREARFAGETKYSLSKMIKFAWSGITHFSSMPLQISTAVGFASAFLCFLWILQALYARFALHETVPGWTSLMVAVLFLGSVQLITLGIIGGYLSKNYDETRSRPLYIVKGKDGF